MALLTWLPFLLVFSLFSSPNTFASLTSSQHHADQEQVVSIKNSSAVAKRSRKLKQCADGRDNDGDGLIDYPQDPGCRNRRDNKERHSRKDPKPNPTPSPTPSPSPTPPNTGGELGEHASLLGATIFPANSPWNLDISQSPVDPNSNNLIASIGLTTGLHADFGTFWNNGPIGIPYVVVSGNQTRQAVTFYYNDESDAGPYPIPTNPPIEGGPTSNGDRHILIVDRDNWVLYELYSAYFTARGWEAGSGAIFDLKVNSHRPAGWTSADAAGLPILPGLVRYDEAVVQQEITHALRFTVQRSRKGYVFPARHHASSNTSPNLPPMGMRVRLRNSVDISGYPPVVQVILRALKRYGMFVADNGSNWFISGTHDPRWDDDALSAIGGIKGQDFEVIEMGPVTTQ